MDRITIENGMQDISSGTCVKFIPRTHEPNFLDIQPRYGWAWLLHMVICMPWKCIFMIFTLWFCIMLIFVLHHKLLVISGADWRKPDPVTADSWVHVVRSGCPWINARPRLCTWAVSLWPWPLCHNRMEKHHARSGWRTTFHVCYRIQKCVSLSRK